MRSIACLGSALVLLSGAAFGQPAPAPGAPPSAQPAPPPAPAQPQQPPYGYPQPYPYAYPYQYPAQGYPPQRPPEEQPAPAAVLPYKDGDPIPPGYELVERPRTGLVTTGWILTGISYGISLIAATSADFANSSGWLAVPFAGPWLTLGRRNYHCDDVDDDGKADDSAACVGDIFVVMGLILDGMMQTAGGTLLLIGYMNQKKELVRQQPAFHLGPTRVGSGYGLGVRGGF